MKRRRNHGVITVLVSLLLVGVLSVGTLSIEAGRYQAAKTQLAESNISATNSMIAAYNADLYARYGLLAIDKELFTTERAMDYLYFNADQAQGYSGNRLSTLYAVDSVELNGFFNLTYPGVMRRQVLTRAKYDIVPQDYALNVYNKEAIMVDLAVKCRYVQDQLYRTEQYEAELGCLEDVPEDVRLALTALYATYADLKTYDESLDVTLSDSTVALLPSTTGTVETPVPNEDMMAMANALFDADDVLGDGASNVLSDFNGTYPEHDWTVGLNKIWNHTIPEILGDMKDISTAEDVHFCATQYAHNASFLASCMSVAYVSQAEEDLLLNSYIVEYFSNRTNRINTYSAPAIGTSTNGAMENAAFSSACVEYILGGSPSERVNQESAYNAMQGMRLIYNLYSVISESNWFDPDNMHSVAAHIAWANFESIIDVELMTKYGISVPLNKNKMILSINDASKVAEAFSTQNMEDALSALGFKNGDTYKIPGSNAFSYEDSLIYLLWCCPNDEKYLQIADLIQLEMRYREQHVEHKTATFLMSDQNTYCRIKCTGKFISVLPVLSLNSGTSKKGIEFQSIKYAGY